MRPTPCIEWTGTRNEKGYGRRSIGGKMVGAHRVAYETAKGIIPDGLEIDHLCRNPGCVNPDHLEAVTHSENCLRGNQGDYAKEQAAQRTHCPHGHAFDEANTYRDGNGHRKCRACGRANQRRYRAS